MLKTNETKRYNRNQRKGGTPMTMDLNERIFYYFNELTKIPHGSRNEKQLSDWLVQFAKDHGLRWIDVYKRQAVDSGQDEPGADDDGIRDRRHHD